LTIGLSGTAHKSGTYLAGHPGEGAYLFFKSTTSAAVTPSLNAFLLPLGSGEFAWLAERRGWINRSPHIYGKEGSQVRLSIPIHGATRLKAGLCCHLAELAGLEDGLEN
jgi:hypothetical protein